MTSQPNALEAVRVRLKGVTPLLQHSARLSDPLNVFAKAIREISGKRKKTEADLMQIAKLEWRGSLYVDDQLNVILPAESIKAALIGGAKREKSGPQARGGTFVFISPVLVHDASEVSIDELWGNGDTKNVHRVSAKVNSSRVMRTRPQFHDWSVEVDIHYDTSQAQSSDILRWLETAGRIIGIGDWRPESSGNFGRFTVERVDAH